MKVSLRTLLCLLVLALPIVGYSAVQQTANKPHETVVDGRWEVKLNAEQQPTVLFEFKNAAGVVTGTMNQDGKLTEIKNGSLEGSTLKFQTSQVAPSGGEPTTMTWKGTLLSDGELMNLSCAAVTQGDKVSEQSQQMQARRVK